MAVPTKLRPVLLRSSGYGEAHHKLLLNGGKRDINGFANKFQGANLFKDVRESNQSANVLAARQIRDQLRANVRKRLSQELG